MICGIICLYYLLQLVTLSKGEPPWKDTPEGQAEAAAQAKAAAERAEAAAERAEEERKAEREKRGFFSKLFGGD